MMNESFREYHDEFLRQLNLSQKDPTDSKLFLRFKDKFCTHHSFLYAKRFSCCSYLVSFHHQQEEIQYGVVIAFDLSQNIPYAYIQRYKRAPINMSDHLELPPEIQVHVDSIFPLCHRIDDFIIIEARQIVDKCITIPMQGYECSTNRRVNHEHDWIKAPFELFTLVVNH